MCCRAALNRDMQSQTVRGAELAAHSGSRLARGADHFGATSERPSADTAGSAVPLVNAATCAIH